MPGTTWRHGPRRIFLKGELLKRRSQKVEVGLNTRTMKRTMGVTAVITVLTMFVSHANAGTAGNGTIVAIHYLSDGVVLFTSTGTRAGAPACATEPSRFAINGSTVGGKAQLAGLLAAYAMAKEIWIQGLNTCLLYGDSESVSYFRTID